MHVVLRVSLALLLFTSFVFRYFIIFQIVSSRVGNFSFYVFVPRMVIRVSTPRGICEMFLLYDHLDENNNNEKKIFCVY